MEVVSNNFMPGDPRLIDHIVYELKSQGIFDNFRKECIADVDTKPAYQNLRQRVEGSVSGFLKTQRWRPDMNKNQVREMLRKNISESGFLETGVERIVDQVVNPKINSIFLPQVENVVYKFLGIQKPSAFDDLRNQVDLRPFGSSERLDTSNNLLPSDLETVSPESEPHDKKLDISNESQKLDDSRMDEDESPPFEPLEESTTFMVQEENSIDSHLSGFSELLLLAFFVSGMQSVLNFWKAMPGKRLNTQAQAMVLLLLEYFEAEKVNGGPLLPLTAVRERVANALKISEASVTTIKQRIKSNPILSSPGKSRPRRKSKSTDLHDGVKMAIRDTIYAMYQQRLASHDSNQSLGVTNKIAPMEISNQDSQLSRQSSDGRLSIIISDEVDTKIEMNEDSTLSKASNSKATDSTSKSFDFLHDTQSSSDKSLQTAVKPEKSEDVKKGDEKPKNDDKKSDKHRSSHKHKSRHDSRSESKGHKGDKDRKSERDKRDHRDKSGHSSKDRKDKDRERKDGKSRNGKDEEGKTDKHEKERDRSRNSGSKHSSSNSSASKDKSSTKKDSSENKPRESETKDLKDSKKGTEHKDSRSKSSKEKGGSSKSKDDSKSKSESKSRSDKSKSDSKSFSKHNGKSGKPESSDSSKNPSKSSSKDDKSYKKEEKRHSHSSSSRKDAKYDKDKKKEFKKDVKDDHYSLKVKKSNRRSTDRDSSDGHSGTHSSSSSFADLTLLSQQQKPSQDTSTANSESSSADSGNSDRVEITNETEANVSVNETISTIQLPPVKLIKPKFASNIFEARRLMKIRKKLGKLEKRNQMELMGSSVALNSSLASTKTKLVSNRVLTYEIVSAPSELDNSENSKRRPNILKKQPNILKSPKANNAKLNTLASNMELSIATAQFYKENKGNVGKPKHQVDSEEENVAEVVEISDDANAAPLRNSVISKESWDAVEAKLNLENILKVDYNSYTDSFDERVAEGNEPSQSEASKKTVPKEDYCVGFHKDLMLESDREVKMIWKLIFKLEDDLGSRAKVDFLKATHKNNQAIYKGKTEMEVDGLNRRLPKVAIVDVTGDNEIIISPSKGNKRPADDHPDIHNNNKTSSELEMDLLNEEINHTTDKVHHPMKTSIAKVKRAKLMDNSVNQVESFSLPLSPAESDKSFNATGDRKNEKVDGKNKRNNTGGKANNPRNQSNQRYSSDDLYKPRLQFSSTRRRITKNADVN